MKNAIELNGEVYALLADGESLSPGTQWFGDSFQPLQASRMVYGAGKDFRAHKHILNPRIIKRTQEAFVVITGKIGIDIFGEDKNFMGTLEASGGEAIFVYRGYHYVKILEGGIFYEIKAGQFTCVSEDKEFFE